MKATWRGFLLLGTVLAYEECREQLKIPENKNERIPELKLKLNKLAGSSIGLCHYFIDTATNITGALSLDIDGSIDGYYSFHDSSFTINSTAHLSNYRKFPYEFHHECSKTLQFLKNDGKKLKFDSSNNHANLRKRRAAKEDDAIKYIELIMVVAQSLVLEHEKDNETDSDARYRPVLKRYESAHNIIDNFYKEAGFRVALLDIILWKEKDEIALVNKQSGTILSSFQKYRSSPSQGLKERWKRVDNSQLIVAKGTFEDTGTIGKAWVGTICRGGSSVGVNEDHASEVVGLATTMAHEMGHNLGLNHIKDKECPIGQKCIMAPSYSLSTKISIWSPASITALNDKKDELCLQDIPEKKLLYGAKNCGNGLVEREEECDCGESPSDECKKCCNHKTCMYHEGKECSDTNGPCCKDCKLRKAGSICRAEQNSCDLPEYCDGIYPYCPQNVWTRNGEKCEEEGRCFSGQCRKRSDQCKKFFGEKAEVNEGCMEKANNRTRGDYSGNCGEMYKPGIFRSENYYDCKAPSDYLCGKIQCEHGSATLQQEEFRDVDVRSRSVEGANCKYVDWRGSRDLAGSEMLWYSDRIPQGTPCGEESICSFQQENIWHTYESFSECVPLAVMREKNEDFKPCPENCNGKGICNSRGNCHCNVGYGGRTCSQRGYGGSVDSGPMIRHVLDENMVSYSVVFGLLFLLAIIGLVVYKFHFGRNISEICYYQPCPGKSAAARARAARQKQEASQNLNRNKTAASSSGTHDIFNQWGDNPSDNQNTAVFKAAKTAEKVKPVYLKELKTTKKTAKESKPPNPAPIPQPQSDPFAVNWGDPVSEPSAIPKQKRPPPAPPAPPKDYDQDSSSSPNELSEMKPAPLPKDY